MELHHILVAEMRAYARWVTILAVGLGLVACTAMYPSARSTTPPIPLEADAQALLAEAVTFAEAGDFEELCNLGGGNCEQMLQLAGEDAVPPEPPTFIGSWVLPTTQRADGKLQLGGRVLVVCGADGRAREYLTEILVFYFEGELLAIEPVYWSNTGIATSPYTERNPPPPAHC